MKRVLLFLLGATILLTVVGTAGQIGKYRHQMAGDWIDLFDLNQEANIPTWYSGSLMLVAGLLSYTLSLIEPHPFRGVAPFSAPPEERKLPRITRPNSPNRYWRFLAFLFFYLSADEMVQLHERLDPFVDKHLGAGGIFYFGWTVVALPILALLGLGLIRFVWQQEKVTRILLLLSAGIFVMGGLGMEMAGGWYANRYGQDNLTFACLTIVEEFLEMSGLTALLYTLARETKARLDTRYILAHRA